MLPQIGAARRVAAHSAITLVWASHRRKSPRDRRKSPFFTTTISSARLTAPCQNNMLCGGSCVMQSGVLLPDPVWNLALVRWMDLRTLPAREMGVEERERQPNYTARPKTVAVFLDGLLPFRRENSALLPV